MARTTGVVNLAPSRLAFSSSNDRPAGSPGVRPAMPIATGSVSQVRAIFISDVHLGTPGCKAEHLLDFLRYHESQYLSLVGDILDGCGMRSPFYWQQTHHD